MLEHRQEHRNSPKDDAPIALENLRPTWPVILLRGLPASAGSLPRFQADSLAGSARDEMKPAVVTSNTYADLQDFYGSDGTGTRDLRRDRPGRVRRSSPTSRSERAHLLGFFASRSDLARMAPSIGRRSFGPRAGHETLSVPTTRSRLLRVKRDPGSRWKESRNCAVPAGPTGRAGPAERPARERRSTRSAPYLEHTEAGEIDQP